VGATRPPVDEGWAAEDQMIGQSGKTVRPRLYIGAGISGMSHHVVGMDGSETVVAINKDPKAPIFDVADICIVGDFREIIPALLEEIRQRLQANKTH
jgi:electron transfer flavoprotein alpha subunit